MKLSCFGRWVVLSCIFLLLASAFGQEEPGIPFNQYAAPNEARSPAEALKHMEVPRGFSVELVVSEPDLVNPIAMCFDEKGRLWVTESFEYPRESAGPGRDRIKVYEDTDQDGTLDRFTIFADDLNIPQGIAVGHGGVWVSNPPDILFMKDTNGDGRADHREVVVTGMGRKDRHEMPNSLTWGPDGYLYMLNGIHNPCEVKQDGRTHRFDAAVMRINPRTRKFELFSEGAMNPWGMAWDSEGQMMISNCVTDHLWHIVPHSFYSKVVGQYAPYTWPMESISDHKHQMAAYCGITALDTEAFPAEYRGMFVMGNIHGGSLNMDGLLRRGASYLGVEQPDFLKANDAWFMPVSQKIGPDGSLYVLDWYDRYHCYQDAMRDSPGLDRSKGRLYRVRYGNTPRAKPFDLGAESDDHLIARLNNGNVFFRETAQRLLAERNQPATRKALEMTVLDQAKPRRQRMHALWALAGTGHLEAGFHEAITRDADAGIRAWALRIAGNMRLVDPAVRERIAAMASDESPDVRLAAINAAWRVAEAPTYPTLMTVLEHTGDDRVIAAMAWNRLHTILEQNADRFVDALTERDWLQYQAIGEVMYRGIDRLLDSPTLGARLAVTLPQRLTEAGRFKLAGHAMRSVAQRIDQQQFSDQQIAAAKPAWVALARSVLSEGSGHPMARDTVILAATLGHADALELASQWVTDPTIDLNTRMDAISLLIRADSAALLPAVQKVLTGTNEDDGYRQRLLGTLGAWNNDRVPHVVLAAYPAMKGTVAAAAIDLLTQRSAWVGDLLDAIDDGQLPATAVLGHQVNRLLRVSDNALTARARKHWPDTTSTGRSDRQAAVDSMRDMSVYFNGNPHRGKVVFERVCAQCHVIYDEGTSIGPDLTGNGRGSFEQLLSNIFDPNLVVSESFQMKVITTTDGRSISGIIAEEDDNRIVIKVPGAEPITLPQAQVKTLVTLPVSLMPEGLEASLRHPYPTDAADLLAFLALDRPPTDPAAKPIPGTPPGLLDPNSPNAVRPVKKRN